MRHTVAARRWRARPRSLAAGAVAAFVLLAAFRAEALFPIRESFRDANDGCWTVLGAAKFTSGDGDPVGDGWLQLTAGNQYETGSAIYEPAFSSAATIVVSFVYASYGGSAPGADGFAFYLLDGDTTSPTLGGDGGSLGYSSQFASCTGVVKIAGVTNGRLGIGFDEYGDFSDCLWGRDGPGQIPDAVAIRGSGNLYDVNGFRYLTGTQISAAPFSSSIATAGRTDPRPVRISIRDGTVQVEMDFGSGYEVVVPTYDFANAPGQAPEPAKFKLGFSGSTGWFTNHHEIRDLLVAMPAALALSHVASTPTVAVGGTITYTVTVANDDQNDVNGIAFSDPVPAGITDVTWTAVTSGNATVSASAGTGNSISATIDLPRAASVTFTIAGTASAAAAGMTLEHAATIVPPSNVSAEGNLSASARVVVDRMATAALLGSSASPSPFGEPITLTAIVSAVALGSGTPTGLVTFLDGGTTLGTATLAGGIATLGIPLLPIGGHALTASYGGDPRFFGSEGSAALEVVHSELCLVQSDCLGDATCIKQTRRGELGVCEAPSGTQATLLGCSSTGGGSLAAVLALVAVALAVRLRLGRKG